MNKLKVVEVESNCIRFDNEIILHALHDKPSYEFYLCFDDLTLDDFKDLEFDLTSDKFFNRMIGYGIELIPIKGHPIRTPGYCVNNGYYTSDLLLVLTSGDDIIKKFEVSDNQQHTQWN